MILPFPDPQKDERPSMTRLDEKLARIRAGQYKRSDFIIADAKDGDMGPSLTSHRPEARADGSWTRYRTRAEFLDTDPAGRGAGHRRHHAGLGLEPRAAASSAARSRTARSSRRSAPTTRPMAGAVRGCHLSQAAVAPVPHGPAAARDAWRAGARPEGPASPAPISASTPSPSTTTSMPTSGRWRPSPSSAPTPPPTASSISSKCSTRTSTSGIDPRAACRITSTTASCAASPA